MKLFIIFHLLAVLFFFAGCAPNRGFEKLAGNRYFPINPEFSVDPDPEEAASYIDFEALYVHQGDSFVAYYRFWEGGQVLLKTTVETLSEIDGDDFSDASIGFYEVKDGEIEIEIIQLNPGIYRYDYLTLWGNIGKEMLTISGRLRGKTTRLRFDHDPQNYVAYYPGDLVRYPDW